MKRNLKAFVFCNLILLSQNLYGNTCKEREKRCQGVVTKESICFVDSDDPTSFVSNNITKLSRCPLGSDMYFLSPNDRLGTLEKRLENLLSQCVAISEMAIIVDGLYSWHTKKLNFLRKYSCLLDEDTKMEFNNDFLIQTSCEIDMILHNFAKNLFHDKIKGSVENSQDLFRSLIALIPGVTSESTLTGSRKLKYDPSKEPPETWGKSLAGVYYRSQTMAENCRKEITSLIDRAREIMMKRNTDCIRGNSISLRDLDKYKSIVSNLSENYRNWDTAQIMRLLNLRLWISSAEETNCSKEDPSSGDTPQPSEAVQ